MRILVVSQYFPPEPGATQNRMGSFVDGLLDRGHQVTVVCEQPNHPAGVFHPGYGKRTLVRERSGSLRVSRLWVAASPKKTPVRRLAFYSTFAGGAALVVVAKRRHDVMLVTSPPLPGAAAAAAAARLKGLPFVLDVRDIWPAAAEALGELTNQRMISAFERLERWLYRSSSSVTTTTRPFCTHIDGIAGQSISIHIPNGALDELVGRPYRAPVQEDLFTVGYAGNLGIAQGLDIVIDAAEELRSERVRFVLVGDGPVRGHLEIEIRNRSLTNVEIRPSVPTADIGGFLECCDGLLVPLRDHPLLEHFIPSKLYDAMAVGRPSIVAARGEAARLARESNSGIVVAPESGPDLAAAVRQLRDNPSLALQLGEAGRSAAPQHSRSRHLDRLENVLDAAAGASACRSGRIRRRYE